MPTISEVANLSPELRKNGKIEGRIKLYHVENENETISDAKTLFQRTVITKGLKDAFIGFKRVLTEEELQRTCLLYGPYGSGKSHHMAALYHLFDDPEISREWLHSEGFGELADLLPTDAITIQRSMQNNQPDELWDPLFNALNTVPDLGEKNYPDIQSIREAVGDQTVALFLDELEDWYDALDDEDRAETRGFLQALLEASTEPDIDLFVIISVLREGSGVHKIIGRESPIEVNMNDRVDTQAVIRKRLLDEDSINYEAIEDITKSYLSAYQQPSFVSIENGEELRKKIINAYPFHPEMFEALRQRWQAEGGDGVRGVVRLLSKVLLNVYEETDLVTGGDIDAITYQDDISPVNYERQEAARRDIEQIDTDRFPYGRRILNTVLIYSLDPQYKEGADLTQIVMGAYRSGEGDSAFNEIRYNLDNLMGDAVHLHRLNGKYAIREEEDVHSKIRDAASEVSEREALSIIADHLREIYGPNRTYTAFFSMDEDGYVIDIDEIPDNKQHKVVIAPKEWTREMLEAVITNRGTGRSYRNTFVFVEPEPEMTIESGTGLLERARYMRGAERLLEREDTAIEERLEERVNEEAETARSELDRRLRDKYGRILDGENMLGNYDLIAHMDADVFVEDGDPMDADDIVEWATVSAWQVEQTIAEVAEDLVRRKGSATITELYEQYLRLPELPMIGSVETVLSAASALSNADDPPLVAKVGNNFSTDFATAASPDTLLLPENQVEEIDIKDAEEAFREQLSRSRRVKIGSVKEDLIEGSRTRLIDGSETIYQAARRVVQDDQYVLMSDNAISDKVRADTEIFDAGSAKIIKTEDIITRIYEAFAEDGSAATGSILTDIRNNNREHLPAEDTKSTFREALIQLLEDAQGDGTRAAIVTSDGTLHHSLESNDPTEVNLRPYPNKDEQAAIKKILTQVGDDETVTPRSIARDADVWADSSHNIGDEAVLTYMIEQTDATGGADFVHAGGARSSKNPFSGTTPDDTFRRLGDDLVIEYVGDDVGELRSKFAEKDLTTDDSATSYRVSTGQVEYTLPNRTLPESIDRPLTPDDTRRTTTEIYMQSEQSVNEVRDVLATIPTNATDIEFNVVFTHE